MLIALGFSMIAVFMYLILAKRLTPTLALVLVPLAFALVVTATGIGAPTEDGVVDSIMDSIKSFAPTATLLFFAIIFFGTMIDVGLFDPLIRFILKAVRNDPVRLVVFTAVLAGVVSLDGDGSTTFIITVSALLPIYLKLGMSPVVLTVVANLANGVLNILPWGGPTVRAATVLEGLAVRAVQPDGAGHGAGDPHGRRAGVLPGPLGAPPPAGVGPHAGAGRRVDAAGRCRRCRWARASAGRPVPAPSVTTPDDGARPTTPRTPTSSAASTRTVRPCGPS